jgi:hypothetical protein
MSFNSSKVKASQDGPWTVTTTPSSAQIVNSLFGSITSVASGVLTTILSYTVPIGKTDYLGQIEVSGDNIAEFDIYINSVLNARQRTYFGGELNTVFEYNMDSQLGFILNAGDIIQVKVIHNRLSLGSFEARILYAE